MLRRLVCVAVLVSVVHAQFRQQSTLAEKLATGGSLSGQLRCARMFFMDEDPVKADSTPDVEPCVRTQSHVASITQILRAYGSNDHNHDDYSSINQAAMYHEVEQCFSNAFAPSNLPVQVRMLYEDVYQGGNGDETDAFLHYASMKGLMNGFDAGEPPALGIRSFASDKDPAYDVYVPGLLAVTEDAWTTVSISAAGGVPETSVCGSGAHHVTWTPYIDIGKCAYRKRPNGNIVLFVGHGDVSGPYGNGSAAGGAAAYEAMSARMPSVFPRAYAETQALFFADEKGYPSSSIEKDGYAAVYDHSGLTEVRPDTANADYETKRGSASNVFVYNEMKPASADTGNAWEQSQLVMCAAYGTVCGAGFAPVVWNKGDPGAHVAVMHSSTYNVTAVDYHSVYGYENINPLKGPYDKAFLDSLQCEWDTSDGGDGLIWSTFNPKKPHAYGQDDPCNWSNRLFTPKRKRVFALGRCNTPGASCDGYLAPGLLPRDMCARGHSGGGTATPSGRCRCSSTTALAYIGPGCDVPPPAGHALWDAFLDANISASGGSRIKTARFVCDNYGSVVCSGAGECRPTTTNTPTVPLWTCSCLPGFFGDPVKHANVYASEFEEACLSASYVGAEAKREQTVVPVTRANWKYKWCAFYAGVNDTVWAATDSTAAGRQLLTADGASSVSGFERYRTATGKPTVNGPVLTTGALYVKGLGARAVGFACTPGHDGPGCPVCAARVSGAACNLTVGYCEDDGVCQCIEPNADPEHGCNAVKCPGTVSQACSGNGQCQASGACACDDGYSGSDCSVEACAFAPDPWAAETSTAEKHVVCGGHGTCDEARGVCVCDPLWDVVSPADGVLVNGEVEGACTWGSCYNDPHGAGECGNKRRRRDANGGCLTGSVSAYNTSVCDHAPPLKNSGHRRAVCQCMAAASCDASLVAGTASAMSSVYYGYACHEPFMLACRSPHASGLGDASAPCDGFGAACYLCEEQADFKECTRGVSKRPDNRVVGDPLVAPLCVCKPGASGSHCQVPPCDPACSTNGTESCHVFAGNRRGCVCKEGFAGVSCEHYLGEAHIDDCVSQSGLASEGVDVECAGNSLNTCVPCLNETESRWCNASNAQSFYCECGNENAYGKYCEKTAHCHEDCAWQGTCECRNPPCPDISTTGDYACHCHAAYGGHVITDGGSCGENVCLSTGGSYDRHHDVCDPGKDPSGGVTFVWDPDAHAVRVACASAGGVECGALTATGASRCTTVTKNAYLASNGTTLPVCRCDLTGTPGNVHQTFREPEGSIPGNTPAPCVPTCMHCSEPAAGVCDEDHCEAADAIDGVCQYKHADGCTEKFCGVGQLLANGSCECPVGVTGTRCTTNSCSPGSARSDGTGCVCPPPYAPAENGTRCVSQCHASGTPNANGTCDCPVGRSGDYCQVNVCAEADCACESPVYTGALCNVSLCENGGTPNAKRTACVCAPAWGDLLCNSSRCGEHGVPSPDGNLCECDAGWDHAGNVATHPCSVSLCGHGVEPTPAAGGYVCPCGDTVVVCETDACQACIEHPDPVVACGPYTEKKAINASTGAVYCSCVLGWTGPLCNTGLCGQHANPRVSWASGTCGCKPPWRNYTGGCVENTCGYGGVEPLPSSSRDSKFTILPDATTAYDTNANASTAAYAGATATDLAETPEKTDLEAAHHHTPNATNYYSAHHHLRPQLAEYGLRMTTVINSNGRALKQVQMHPETTFVCICGDGVNTPGCTHVVCNPLGTLERGTNETSLTDACVCKEGFTGPHCGERAAVKLTKTDPYHEISSFIAYAFGVFMIGVFAYAAYLVACKRPKSSDGL